MLRADAFANQMDRNSALWRLFRQGAAAWRGSLCPYYRQEWSDPDDVHEAREIVGEHVQRHFRRSQNGAFGFDRSIRRPGEKEIWLFAMLDAERQFRY
jgi:hypothetical protein